jgi:outer membrane lipoprotein-sorting protein
MERLKLYSLAAVSAFILLSQPLQSQQAPDADEIIRRMVSVYDKANSYQDVGIVQRSSASKPDVFNLVNSFKTFFVRPAHLRFQWAEIEFREPEESNIIWSDGTGVFSYSHLMGLEKEESISMAVAGATGISSGAAHTVTTLLIPDVSGFRITEMKGLTLLREENFEGTGCFVVRGYHPFGFPIDIWVGKNDFLLRRMRQRSGDDGEIEEEIRRDVKLDEAIPASVFQYTVPSKTERLIGCLSMVLIPLVIILSLRRK